MDSTGESRPQPECVGAGIMCVGYNCGDRRRMKCWSPCRMYTGGGRGGDPQV